MTNRNEYIAELVRQAQEEEAREGGKFDRNSWDSFFPEDCKTDPEAVAEAWRVYKNRKIEKALHDRFPGMKNKIIVI